MLRNMWHPQGGLLGSLSAVDEADVEGGHYLWDREQLAALLDEDALALIEAAWGIDNNPFPAQGYLPMQILPLSQLAIRFERSEEVIASRLRHIHQHLLRERERRTLPADDKRLAGWNGLALSALSLASLEDEAFLPVARLLGHYLHSLWDGEQPLAAARPSRPAAANRPAGRLCPGGQRPL
jgi:uncharacterized protein